MKWLDGRCSGFLQGVKPAIIRERRGGQGFIVINTYCRLHFREWDQCLSKGISRAVVQKKKTQGSKRMFTMTRPVHTTSVPAKSMLMFAVVSASFVCRFTLYSSKRAASEY
jgi:hypothetical protein